MTLPPRVVLDTNVVLSALIFVQGRLTPLRQQWQQGRCRPLVCTLTTAELIRALGYPKFRLSVQEQHELLADYLPYCTPVKMPAVQPVTLPCRDPLDTPLLALAVAGQADFFVTGDKDLLSLADAFAPPIVTAERFLALLI
ncbi:putative toxin-antitoxin system toxin component, PIN family [Gloeobacter violaceus]|uniref:Glr0248 protein n=1 Tax=Gloeobacter violaceus (strain ATCC 29082 / PCC 7421) TaxID=251221 RepID=Q7NP10_GLOVI|nr:putative toxin-antitoxin system toxin component, PIN family [Gloeobacter violaceus]BAC88189.1 glr0248 [Gloeobacter violaceus PCC 7421]